MTRALAVTLSLLGVAAISAAQPADLSSEPLAPRSAARGGGPLFTALAPEETGVVTTNPYADPRMWGDRNREYAVGELGTGVAVADYDGDGRPDLFTVSKTGQNRLFRNRGGWRFEDVTESAGLMGDTGLIGQGLAWLRRSVGASDAASEVEHWKQGATFADVNNDGWLDLYVCRFGAANLLYINQGDGTFREEAEKRGLALVDSSCVGAFCDFDRDGWLDVYVQTNMLDARTQPMGRRDRLFRNRGDGTFEDVTDPAGIRGDTQGHSITWWDYNEDGWPDIHVANDFAPADSLYRNNGDGTFTDLIHQVVPVMPYSSMGADLADVNNDGHLDLLVAEMAPTTHEKDQRGMAVVRELSRPDEDSATLSPQLLRNVLYLGTGTHAVLEAAHQTGLHATDWTWSVRFEDLDNDGWVDLHVTNGMDREYQNADLRERVFTANSEEGRVGVMKNSPMLQEKNLAYRNHGGLRFEEVGRAWGLDQEGVSFGAAFGDFDGDGDLDLVHANYEAPPTLLRNDSDKGNRLVLSLRGRSSNRFGVGAIARLETGAGLQTRQLLVARGSLSSSEPVLHFGLGTEERVKRLTIDWPGGHRQTFTDLAANLRYTVTEPQGTPERSGTPGGVPANASRLGGQGGSKTLFESVGAARALDFRVEETFETETQALLPLRFDRSGPALAASDVDGDGRTDVLVGGTGKQGGRILGNGERFGPVAGWPGSRVDDGPLLVFEANGDGRPDLLLTRTGTTRPAGSDEYQPVLHLNGGRGFETAAGALPPLSISAGAAVTVDFDRDGRLDLFIGARLLPRKYPQAPRSVLLLNRGGRFDDVTHSHAPSLADVGMVTSAVWSDVDLDGWPDLVLTLHWGGVRYFRNDEGRGLVDESEQAGFAAAGTGWWSSVVSADFNEDGRPDFAVGNIGLNTPYRAPFHLVTGSFTGRNTTQLVEAVEEHGVLYPRRTLQTLAAEIPELKRRFPRNDDYARASLGDVLGEQRLAAAQRLTATTTASGILLSRNDGSYEFRPLPGLAQLGPIHGMVALDFDADGHVDLCLVQNSHAPVPAIGRFVGGLGLFLQGKGDGEFTAVPLGESGFVVPGDAKAMVALDLEKDGRPDLLVSRNSASALAFRNAAKGQSVRVTLKGPAGNPTGIGSRVELVRGSGERRVAEVQGGSGYFSQSEPACFFAIVSPGPHVLEVRWADGQHSTHAITGQDHDVVVPHPGG